MNLLAAQIARFSTVGLANTVLGLAVIWGLMVLGVSPVLSNICGYGAGLMLSFTLNRKWTFRISDELTPARKGRVMLTTRFLIAFAIALAVNLITLNAGLHFTGFSPYVLQLVSICVHSIIFFLLCRYFVFG